MLWWQNIPFFSIMLCLLSAPVCMVLSSAAARRWLQGVLSVCFAGAAALLFLLRDSGGSSFTFMMGHFPAPWGNEIRCGLLEALLGCLFPLVMLCAVTAGGLSASGGFRSSLFTALCALLMAALLSQVYSNDLFPCYVFLEMMTMAACGLIVFRNTGRSLAAAVRYMVLNLVGSGLFLLGLVMLYDLTGHLLMENLHQAVRALADSSAHSRSLTIALALMTVGLCVKSALFPFHAWVPDAYSSGIPASNAIVSSLVSKGYIVILLKLYARVFGWDLVLASRVDHLLLLFSLSGIVAGSVAAIRASGFTRMIAWSSVAQIGYIYLGIALGAGNGYQAACFHLMVHAVSKSLLFLSGGRLLTAAGGRDDFASLAGAARRDRAAGVCWTAAAFSMVGLPFTGGLVSKLLLGSAALEHSWPVAAAVLAALALSTLLHVLYFLRTVLLLWSPAAPGSGSACPGSRSLPGGSRASACACAVLALCVVFFFVFASPLLRLISLGLTQF